MTSHARRVFAFVATCTALVALSATTVSAEVITTIAPAFTETGWFVDVSNTGSQRLVEGPATPPEGRGSLELGVADTAQIALLSTALGSTETAPAFRPFDLTGSWSTFVPVGTDENAAPDVKLPAFLDASATPTGFTTVNFEPIRNGTVTPGEWQTWTIGPDATVWQTNAGETFCRQASPCTLSAFAANYPNARFFGAQLGIGSGVVASLGYVDALTIVSGTDTFDFDFETTTNSTATIGAATAGPSGGSATVTLNASTTAGGPVSFVIDVGGTPQTVDVEPGVSTPVTISLPFGDTPVTVSAQGVALATTTLSVAPPPTAGYLIATEGGRTVGFGLADDVDEQDPLPADEPVVGIAAAPGEDGWWTVTRTGVVLEHGAATWFGDFSGVPLNHPMVGIAATPSALGYWAVASDGGVFSFGNAAFWGSTGAMVLNRPIVGMASTPSGNGYWLVASDGGIFAYGDAAFHGSLGSIPLNQPVVGIASTPSGNGYWMVARDGGIFAFGDAVFSGSTGSIKLNQPIVGMASTPTGAGYWFTAGDGGVFAFGDAGFYGSGAGQLSRVVGLAGTGPAV